MSALKKFATDTLSPFPLPGTPGFRQGWVLLVDDEPEMRTIGRIALEQVGYRVLDAENGQQALAQLAGHPGEVGLVISDVMMPDMDGMALVRKMHDLGESIPIILLSGHVLEEDLWGDSMARVRYMPKPFHLHDLQTTVMDMIGPAVHSP